MILPALATGSSYVYCMFNVEGDIEMGNLRPMTQFLHPFDNGSITRSIGREDKDSSPKKEACRPIPEVKPSMRRKPLPDCQIKNIFAIISFDFF